MKVKILFLTSFLISVVTIGKSQGTDCFTADPFCTGSTYTFPNSTSTADLGPLGCLGSSPNPAWYYLNIATSGDLNIHIEQYDLSGSPIDVDFICWGPVTSVATGCAGGIPTASSVDCSYSTAAIEDCYIPSAVAGETYLLLLTNYADVAGDITFSQTSGSGSTDCSILCGVTGFTAVPSACNAVTNLYSVSGTLTITSPPTTGTATFTNSCGGTPVVVNAPFPASIPYSFSGLTSNGAGCTVSVTFSANAACNSTVPYVAPPSCTSSCLITFFNANVSAPTCGALGGTYGITGTVNTTSPPATGTLTVSSSCGGSQVFSAPFAAVIPYSLAGITANGLPCTVTAVYSAVPACTQSIAYTAPTCPCNMNSLFVNIGACDAVTNTYTVDVDLDFSSPPAGGTLTFDVCGTVQTFFPPFVSPMSITFTGLPVGAGACTVTCSFSASPGCSTSIGYTAPFDCSCPVDIGTFTSTLTGSGTTNYITCFGDDVSIIANGDFVPPNDNSAVLPGITYDPGLWLLVYSCPPTVFPPADLFDPITGVPMDPCYIGVESTVDGVWDIVNTLGDGSTLYYVPISMYSMVDGIYSGTNSLINCYALGTPIPITFLPPMTAIPGGQDETCLGACDGFAVVAPGGGTGAYTFSWTGPATGTNALLPSLCSGTYNVTVTDGNGCTATATQTINGAIAVVITSTPTTNPLCNGAATGTITVNATGTGALTYSINGGAFQASNVFAGLIAGTYTVVAKDANGCTATATVVITQPTAVTVVAGPDVTICIGASTTITANAAGGTGPYVYTWTNNVDPTVLIGANQTVFPIANTTYTVSVVDANGCGPVTDQTIVTINPPLAVVANTTQSICPGTSANISAVANGGNGIYTYTWTNNIDGTVLTGANQTVSPSVTTIYTVTVTDNCGTPAATDAITISIFALPAISITPYFSQGCSPLTVNFTNLTMAGATATCFWDFGDGSTSTNCNPTHVFTAAGCYDISLNMVTSDGCLIDTTVFGAVCVFPIPIADFTFGPQPTDIFATEITFDNLTLGGNTYAWDFAGLGTSTQVNPTFTFPVDNGGNYIVCLSTVSTNGCVDTACHNVIIDDVFLIYVPNTFTADGDGINDIFLPILQGEDPLSYELMIFDRWGELIFVSDNKLIGWDGTHKGIKSKEDVYVWKIRVKKKMVEEHLQYIGHVNLLR